MPEFFRSVFLSLRIVSLFIQTYDNDLLRNNDHSDQGSCDEMYNKLSRTSTSIRAAKGQPVGYLFMLFESERTWVYYASMVLLVVLFYVICIAFCKYLRSFPVSCLRFLFMLSWRVLEDSHTTAMNCGVSLFVAKRCICTHRYARRGMEHYRVGLFRHGGHINSGLRRL
jgi:hypothetical protein